MIEWKQGCIWDTEASSIVVTVNCVGVMGKGLALECKKRYPYVFGKYRNYCRNKIITPGSLVPVDVRQHVSNTTLPHPKPLIVLAATKDHWRDPSKIEWIESILGHLRRWGMAIPNISMAVPPLGCGNGGLSWSYSVRSLFVKYLGGDDTATFEVFEPE